MSNYKQHIAFSLFLSTFVLYMFMLSGLYKFTWDTLKLIPISIFFAILPDVDIRTSKAFKTLLKLLLILIIMFIVFYLICPKVELLYYVLIIVLLLFLSLFFKHRGKFHSILFAFILTIPLLFIGVFYFVIGLTSYISHLIADKEIKLL